MRTLTSGKAFAVMFQDLMRWNVNSFYAIHWMWPAETIKPLAEALDRKTTVLDKTDNVLSKIVLVSLHFNGEMEPRDTSAEEFKGRLYEVSSGDVIYSKIDVRHGAIGVVPESLSGIAVSSEFPIYRVRPHVALPEYVKLLFRTTAFRRLINSLISGASGRKRVQPTDLEDLKVPLPDIPIQQAIVNHWRTAETATAAAMSEMDALERRRESDLCEMLGVRLSEPTRLRGQLILEWQRLERWDTFFYRPDFLLLDDSLRRAQAVPLGELAIFFSRPWRKEMFPDGCFPYVEISGVNKRDGIVESRPVPVDQAPSRATTLIREGDLMLSTTRPYLGAFAIVPKAYDRHVCSSGFSLCRSADPERVDVEYLLLFLKSGMGLRQMERRMSGGLYPAIVQSELDKVLVPLPSLSRQREIVRQHALSRARIASLKTGSQNRLASARHEVEAMILGTRKVKP